MNPKPRDQLILTEVGLRWTMGLDTYESQSIIRQGSQSHDSETVGLLVSNITSQSIIRHGSHSHKNTQMPTVRTLNTSQSIIRHGSHSHVRLSRRIPSPEDRISVAIHYSSWFSFSPNR